MRRSLNYNQPEEYNLPQNKASSAIDLLSQAILPKAAELARAGKYYEAESMLLQLIQEGSTLPALFDLLAKIRAQQGRLMEAQAYWVEASNYDSANEYYRAALKCIGHLQSYPAWIRKTVNWLLRLGLVFGVVLLVFTARFYLHNVKIPAPVVKNILPQRPAAVLDEKPPKITVNIPGVLVSTQTNQVVITFASGLFLHGAELLPEAKKTLELLAEQLRPYQGKIKIHVEGHTDNLPLFNSHLYLDNESLGLQRAVEVVDYLRLIGMFPSEMFTASGLGEFQAIYPNDSLPNRLRNRTVALRITAKEDG